MLFFDSHPLSYSMRLKHADQIKPNDAVMTVIGAGSYGTSLAIALARNGSKIVLWGHNPVHMTALEEDRSNEEFYPVSIFQNLWLSKRI